MEKILHILLFIWSTGTNMVRKVFPAYLAGFVPSAFLISLVTTGYNVGKSLSIPCGIASDKMGKIQSLMLSFFLISIVALLISLTTNLFHYVILFVVIGIVSNFYYNANNALISLQKRKTESFFKMEAFYQIGLFIGPIIGGWVVSFYSMTLALYAWAILGLIGFAISTVLSKREHLEKKSIEVGKFFRELRKNNTRCFSFFLVGSMFTGLFFGTMNFTMPLYIIGLGMEIYHVGIVIGAGAVISTIGTYLLGSVFQKFSKEKSFIIIMIVTGISFFAMTYSFDIVTLSLIYGIFNIARAGGLNISRALIAGKTTEGTRATSMAFLDMLHFGGAFIGPLCAGLLIDTINIQSVFLLIFGISIIGIAIILFEIYVGGKHATEKNRKK
ncbi:MAG: MFS transporter [Candidatus Aenigmarchaeota archaeon]|nr:MFS transporter [Candidatus Aenigmarchaeota archaeon]